MTTRTRTETIWRGLLATMAIALVAAQVGLSFQSREQAQILLAPSFTAEQAAAGRASWGVHMGVRTPRRAPITKH